MVQKKREHVSENFTKKSNKECYDELLSFVLDYMKTYFQVYLGYFIDISSFYEQF